jgi:hypothetical protein
VLRVCGVCGYTCVGWARVQRGTCDRVVAVVGGTRNAEGGGEGVRLVLFLVLRQRAPIRLK